MRDRDLETQRQKWEHREPEKRMWDRYWETQRQSRATLNLKDRYRKSQRETDAEAQRTWKENVRLILGDTETEQGRIEPQGQIPEVAERDAEAQRTWKENGRQILRDTETEQGHITGYQKSQREREMQRQREPEKRMWDRYWETQRQNQGHIEPQRQIPEVAERDRCGGTENLKRECETDTGRHRDKAGPHWTSKTDTESRRDWDAEAQRTWKEAQILGDTETEQGQIEPQRQIPEVAEREREMQRHREPEKRMWDRYWETQRQSRSTLNLKNRYRKSQRERDAETQRTWKENGRQILWDTETKQGHIESQKQIPEVAEREREMQRHRETEKRMGDRYWETQRQSRAILPDTGSRRERDAEAQRTWKENGRQIL
jgi:hypothetical protein